MNTFDLSLDLSKSRNVNPIRLRQGDLNGTTIRALVFDHGALADLGGTTARWVMRLPGGEEYYRKSATVDATASTVTVEVDETQAASVTGRCRGYFQLLQGGSVIASTGDVLVEVLPDALEGATVAESYDSAIQDAIDALDAAVEAIPDTVEDVLSDHPEWTTTVQDGAVTEAKLADGLAQDRERLLMRLDNLLTAALPEGDAATATDAARTPMAGLALYGRSTQDGTPTPEAPVPIVSVGGNLLPNNGSSATSYGVTFTVNADGSVTCSGTATAQARFDIGRDSTTLPAGTYVCGEGTGSGYTIDVYKVVEETATRIRSGFGPFTLDAETSVFVRIVVASGATVSATISPYIYRGPTPLPFVPYGCAGLWARGRNLYHQTYYAAGFSETVNGCTFTYTDENSVLVDGAPTVNTWKPMNSTATDLRFFVTLPAGTYTASKSTALGQLLVRKLENGAQATVANTTNTSVTFTLDAPTMVAATFAARAGETYSDVLVHLQIQQGTTATAYQPYASTVTPIDLDGHELRSLPDGTRDELTVDARGHAVLVQRVGVATLDGTQNWSASSTAGIAYRVMGDARKESNVDNALCDHFAASIETLANMADPSFKLGLSGGANPSELLYFKSSAIMTSVADLKTWLASNPTTVTYPLAEPVTHDLGHVDPVALQGPDLVAQSIPAAPFALTYERDLNVTLARLEAALAALA